MNGLFSNKNLGVWDAMTLATDLKHKQEDREKKLKLKKQQAELRQFYLDQAEQKRQY